MSGATKGPKKYAYIDALRGLAASGIIFHHVPRLYLGKSINAFLSLAASGVPVFFMLSALTLFISYNNRKGDDEKRPVLNFFIRRLFRIAPLFYVLILYFLWYDNFGLHLPNEPALSVGFFTILANITFTFGLNPYWISSIVHNGWSIGTEMLFYVCVPLLYRKITTLKKALWFFIFSLFLGKGVTFVLAHFIAPRTWPGPIATQLWNAYYYQSIFSQLPIFALGILLYFLIKAYENNKQAQGDVEYERITLARPLLILFVLLFINSALHTLTTDGLIPKFVIEYAVLYITFIFSLYLNPTKFLVNKVTMYLGKISYSLYLTHAVVIFAVEKIIPNHIFGYSILNYLFFVAVVFTLTVVLATFTYHVIEKPGQQLGKKIIDKLEHQFVSHHPNLNTTLNR